MRWRKYNGLVLRQTVNAHVKEAAHLQTQNGEENYQSYFHGCLLWTYYVPEVNSSLVLLPGAARADIVGTFISSLPVFFLRSLRGWLSQPKQSDRVSSWCFRSRPNFSPLMGESQGEGEDEGISCCLCFPRACQRIQRATESASVRPASSGRDRSRRQRYSRCRRG
jgi:hypothetical protein